MLSVTLTGAETLQARLDGLPAAVLAAVGAKSAALADELLAAVRGRLTGGALQSRSGALAASVVVNGPRIDGDRVVVSLSAGGDLKYAAIQEYGGVTAPHEILPSRGKALAFLAGGGEAFAKVVHHPGSHIPPHRYLAGALAEMAAEIDAGLKAAALEAVRGQVGG